MKKLLIAIFVPVFVMITTACTGHVSMENDAEKGDVLCFDAASAGWENASSILLVLSDLDSGDCEELVGARGDHDLWMFDAVGADVQISHVYTVVFHHTDTDAETYPLLLDPSCFGDTAYADQRVLEDPSDSDQTLCEVRWKNSALGPMLRITSLGNVVGETIPPNTTAYLMLVDFLACRDKGGLTYALRYSGKSPQSGIDTVAGALNLTKEDVVKAIEEAKSIGHSITGDKTDWSKLWDASQYQDPVVYDKTGPC